MCEFCATPWWEEVPLGRSDIRCAWADGPPGSACSRYATHLFRMRCVAEHLCAEHARERASRLGEFGLWDLMDVLQGGGKSSGETGLKPIPVGRDGCAICCNVLTPPALRRPATFAHVTLSSTAVCDAHLADLRPPKPVTPVDDYTMALRIAGAATQAVPAVSIEAYWAQWDAPEIKRDIDKASRELVVELRKLWTGEAHLALPDGTRWICSMALDENCLVGSGDNRFLRWFDALHIAHESLRDHVGGPAGVHTSRRPILFVRQDTLDHRRVFCADCKTWCDLQADAEEADRTLGPRGDIEQEN